MGEHCFIASFDNLGFDCIIDATARDKQALFQMLQDKPVPRLPLNEILLRARANPQRNPEIWKFWSELSQYDLMKYAEEMPQQLANLIRENGEVIYKLAKSKTVIK